MPFMPLWQAKIGPEIRQGSGLIDRDLFPFKDAFDEFQVFCDGFRLLAKPKTGELFADSRLVASLSAPCRLIWSRNMAFALATMDHNHSAAHCQHYNFGLELSGVKFGYRIMSDGTARQGEIE